MIHLPQFYVRQPPLQLTTSWKEEGRNEGRHEGEIDASRQLVTRLLRRRWPDLSPSVAASVQKLSVPQLQDLAEALWDISSVKELENWLERQ